MGRGSPGGDATDLSPGRLRGDSFPRDRYPRQSEQRALQVRDGTPDWPQGWPSRGKVAGTALCTSAPAGMKRGCSLPESSNLLCFAIHSQVWAKGEGAGVGGWGLTGIGGRGEGAAGTGAANLHMKTTGWPASTLSPLNHRNALKQGLSPPHLAS